MHRLLGTIFFVTLAACGAGDRVAEATDRVSEELEERRVCVEDSTGACPLVQDAAQLIELAIDDCYDVLTIDSGPDATCCFGVTVELSVGAAIDCL